MRTALLTILTLVAFASNSILCRMALGSGSIDPTSFTTVRLICGALVLIPLSKASSKQPLGASGSWPSAIALFAYAMTFSLAYVSLSTATGALILFGTVQITMIAAGLFAGERPRLGQWAGFLLAAAGLVYLLLPGATAPSLGGAILMAVAGAAWGVYSLRGRGVPHPLAVTAANFARSVPMTMAASAIFFGSMMLSPRGVILAAISGGVTSGLGYAIWYTALRGHTATSAAVVQLAVPLIAAAGGVAVLDERPTLRLGIATVVTLSGILLTAVAGGGATGRGTESTPPDQTKRA